MDPISQALNTTFDTVEDCDKQIAEINQEIVSIEKKKEKLKSKIQNMQDKEYLEFELKDLIASNQAIKHRLEDELLKPGTKSSYFEVYTMISTTILSTLRELRQLNMDIVHMCQSERKLDIKERELGVLSKNPLAGSSITNNLFLDASALDKMISDAREKSEFKQVKAEFTVDSENIKDK